MRRTALSGHADVLSRGSSHGGVDDLLFGHRMHAASVECDAAMSEGDGVRMFGAGRCRWLSGPCASGVARDRFAA